MTVYVLGHTPETGPVKIGSTGRTAEVRLAEVRTGSDGAHVPPGVDCTTLELLYEADGGQQLERWLHYMLHNVRVSGEWFDLGTRPTLVTGYVSGLVQRYINERARLASYRPISINGM